MEILIFGGVAILVVGFIVFKISTKKKKTEEVANESSRQETKPVEEKSEEADSFGEFEKICEDVGGKLIQDRHSSRKYNCKISRKTQFSIIKDKEGNWSKIDG